MTVNRITKKTIVTALSRYSTPSLALPFPNFPSRDPFIDRERRSIFLPDLGGVVPDHRGRSKEL